MWKSLKSGNNIILTNGRSSYTFDLERFQVPVWDLDYSNAFSFITGLYKIYEELKVPTAPQVIEMIEGSTAGDAFEVAYSLNEVFERIKDVYDDLNIIKDEIESIYEDYALKVDMEPLYISGDFLATHLDGNVEVQKVDFDSLGNTIKELTPGYVSKDFLEFTSVVSNAYFLISKKRS